MTRSLFRAAICASLLSRTLSAGELYYTGFENFSTGYNTIAGPDGWTGSSTHLTLNLSGVDAETDHLVAGIGNAAFIGGNDNVMPSNASSSYRTVNVRKPVNVDPVALGQEVVQFRVNFGIKDSISSGFQTRRDNFEFAFYNQSGQLIGFIQFDNSTIDSTTSAPKQSILRSSYNTSFSRWEKAATNTVFYYDLLMELVVRINFRTNRWSAALDGLDIFADQVFYTGSNAKNLGFVAAQMQIVNPVGAPTGSQLWPGNNYMLFDDFAVRIDPIPDVTVLDFTRNASTGATSITWWTEALYKYQLQYSEDLTQWKTDLPGSFLTAASTGVSPVFTDSTAAGRVKRFYRVVRTLP